VLDLVDESPEAVLAAYEAQGWGDGLPLVAPTRARVGAMLAGLGDVDPDAVIATLLLASVRPHRILAVNAVLAGCARAPARAGQVRPRRPRSTCGVNATTHPVAPLLIVHGEIAERGLQQRPQRSARAIGPMPTGRALRLVLLRRRGRPVRRRVDAGWPAVRLLRGREPRRDAMGCYAQPWHRGALGGPSTAVSAAQHPRHGQRPSSRIFDKSRR
jgi:hypothetical protein